MSAAVLRILPKPKGRPAHPDGRAVLKLYPTNRSRRVFIYAIAFKGGVVKVGQTANPRTRLLNHWKAANGEVQWVHLFESMHRDTANLAERRAVGALGNAGAQINGSEWFFMNVTRAEVIALIRPLIAQCKDEIWRRFADQEDRAAQRLAVIRLLDSHGLLDAVKAV